jgi:hypothetical protein
VEATRTTDTPKGRKRAREESSPVTERPSQRVRSQSPSSVEENPDINSDDDDDDEDGMPFLDLDEKVSYDVEKLSDILTHTRQVADNYMDAEDLFQDLRAQFKARAHVDFHGTYPIEEDNLVTPKECTHMLAEELWKVTGYRFT